MLLELNSFDLDKVKISPIGACVGIDGREFFIDGAKIIKNIQKNDLDLPLKLNHSSGESYGWFLKNSFELRNDGIYAKLELTTKGKELIDSKAYRYLSPEYFVDNERNVNMLTAVGLVNEPNLLNKALNYKGDYMDESIKEELEEISKIADELESKAENTDELIKENSDNEELAKLKAENEELKALVSELQAKLENALNKEAELEVEANKSMLKGMLERGEILPKRYAKAINMRGAHLSDYLEVCKAEAKKYTQDLEHNFVIPNKTLSKDAQDVRRQLGL